MLILIVFFQRRMPGFKLALWRTIKQSHSKLEIFHLRNVHNIFISSNSRQKKVKTCPKNCNILIHIKIHLRTTSDRNMANYNLFLFIAALWNNLSKYCITTHYLILITRKKITGVFCKKNEIEQSIKIQCNRIHLNENIFLLNRNIISDTKPGLYKL